MRKLDGHRAIYSSKHNGIDIFTRHGNIVTKRYPELLSPSINKNVVLDGEIIVTDISTPGALPKPNFEKLIERFQTTNEQKIRYLMKQSPVTFVVFDILYLEGENLMTLPLYQRKKLLEDEIENTENIVKMQYIEGNGEALFDVVKEQDLEGIVAKSKNSIYIPDKRVNNWLKVLNYKYSDDIWISGYRKSSFGLLASIKDEGRMKPVGIIEHGSKDIRREFYKKVNSYLSSEQGDFVYIQPFVKVRVKFLHWTSKGYMRIPVLLDIIE